MAMANGWECHLVYHGDKGVFMKGGGNADLVKMTNATYEFVKVDAISNAMDSAMERYKAKGLKPYYVHGGGHDLPGGIAYVNAIQELKANCDLTLFAQDSNIFIDKLDNRDHKVIFDTNYDVYSNNVLARDFECINLRHGFFVNVTLFRQDEDNNIDINMFTSNWNMKLYIPPIRPIKVTFTRKKPISLVVANAKKTDKFTYKKPLNECDNNEITTNLKNYKIKNKNDNANINK